MSRELTDKQAAALVDLIMAGEQARCGIGQPPVLVCPPPVWWEWLAGRTVDLRDLATAIAIRLKASEALVRELLWRSGTNSGDRAVLLRVCAAGEWLLAPVDRPFAASLAYDLNALGEERGAALVNSGDYVATPKLDGVRCLAWLCPAESHNCWELHTRDGRTIQHHQPIVDALREATGDMGPCVIDGELLATDGTWSSTIRALHGTGPRAIFHAFDLIPWREIDTDHFRLSAEHRWTLLRTVLRERHADLVRGVERWSVRSLREGHLIHRGFRDAGHEGTVLHHRLAPYRPGPSRAWLKIKDWQSADLRVTGVYVTDTGSVRSLLVAGEHCGRQVSAAVSAGLTAIDRANGHHPWMAAKVEVRFQSITASGSLRSPVFMRRRDVEHSEVAP